METTSPQISQTGTRFSFGVTIKTVEGEQDTSKLRQHQHNLIPATPTNDSSQASHSLPPPPPIQQPLQLQQEEGAKDTEGRVTNKEQFVITKAEVTTQGGSQGDKATRRRSGRSSRAKRQLPGSATMRRSQDRR
eukprot:TRINITY_DN3064_c0_g1_i3.p1 TRINITY_DN3064_c0_g1~~TRINITY_DN3064_c0_g1_i3.p1  ORF type:complete len:134 (+),score=22.36 TRINITY_DN3064_c0_g1_i3:74-475(+)